MADAKPRRVALGFHAGGALSLRLTPEKLQELQRLLTSGAEGFREIEADDGAVLVNLAQVIYVRVESDEQKIGF
ncbi:MAG: hypothetical protein QOE86_2495 [Solirubrobacteraceae bacterium]|jgi:hypothetical protein|nr:hypothetical protein [Solirubrobacteraceae bacterium]